MSDNYLDIIVDIRNGIEEIIAFNRNYFCDRPILGEGCGLCVKCKIIDEIGEEIWNYLETGCKKDEEAREL